MSSPSRREVLATIAATGLAGCLSPASGSGPDSADRTTSAESTDSATPDSRTDRIAVEADVVAPATDEHPTRTEYRVRNNVDSTLAVQSYEVKPFTMLDRFVGASGAAVFVPLPLRSGNVFSDNVASTQVDECWRFVTASGDEAALGSTLVIEQATIEPGDTYTVRHSIYYERSSGQPAQDGDRPPCFPPGEYRTTTRLSFWEQRADGDRAAKQYRNVNHALVINSDGSPRIDIRSVEPCDSPEDCYQEAGYTPRPTPAAETDT